MTRKPAALQFGVADIPPRAVIISNALQYVAVLSGSLLLPLIMAGEAHVPSAVADSVLSWSVIVLAIGATLQALPKGPVGSGYLVPSTMTAVYVGPTLAAVHLGGLSMVAGMTMLGGAMEAVISRSINRLRVLMPPELAGVVIVLVEVENGMLGYRYLLTTGSGHPPASGHWTVAAITLLVMIGASVWGRGLIRACCVLIGMVAGAITAMPAGLLPRSELGQFASLPVLAFPRVDYFGWSFSAVLFAPFFVAAMANTLKAAALITAAERQADPDWVRPDVQRIRRGVLADGLATLLSGLFCSVGTNISAAAVGLNEAAGVASRVVAYAVSVIFIAMAFIPDLMHCFLLMPRPVVGAAFLFTSCAILKSGIETIASRMLDARRTLVVGMGVLTGVAVEAFPAVFHAVPASVAPVIGSPLVLGTAVAFVLNLAFRAGARRRSVLEVVPSQIDFDAVHSFIEGLGGLWGARRDIITRASFAAQQLIEVIAENCEPRGRIALSGSFDEFNLAVEARYDGVLLELPERRPSETEIRESEDAARLLAGFLLRHNADRTTASRRGETCVVRFQFQH